MKIKYILFLLSFFSFSTLFGQTKLISHKSHSGSDANFAIALENNLFDIGDSNFGDVPFRRIKTAQLDSLIFLSDTSVVMVTSEYCGFTDDFSNKKDEKKKIFDTQKWKAGKDTVFHHDLFSRQIEINEIRRKLEKDYFFNNSVDSIKFIDHDAPTPPQQQARIPKSKKQIRKENRQARKAKRKEKRQAKKECDCDCDCDDEEPIQKNENQNSQNQNQNNYNQNQNNENQNNQNQSQKLSLFPPIGGIGLFAILIGIFVSRRSRL